MTTCPPRNENRPRAARRGFTLIEIVIVLLIISLVTGGSIAALLLNSSERKLRGASSEIELLAKKARAAAILNQKPYAIEFHSGGTRLTPLSSLLGSGPDTAPGGASVGSGAPPAIHQDISLDPDITLSVRRWNTTDFIELRKDETQVWRFDPDGLIEPITVRLTLGDSYSQDTYHPLTATIAESELEAN